MHEPTEAPIAAAPHELLARLSAAGYSFDHRRPCGPKAPPPGLIVRAFAGGRVVGEAEFSDGGHAAHCQIVHVEEAHRRRGLATAMYLLAERAFGKPLWDYWADSDHQTDAARAMWADPARPFGRPLPSVAPAGGRRADARGRL